MADTLAANCLDPDSEDDFASASEGEDAYESMDTPTPSTPALTLTPSKPTALRQGKQHSMSVSIRPPLPSHSRKMAAVASTLPIPAPASSFNNTGVQHDQLYRQHEPLVERIGRSGHEQTVFDNSKDVGQGWGSLSSWINTAVSTVSEVIEHPNVVVSRAHTLGQGIRNVATEQIDRVYESLDPEYEYERERQSREKAQGTTTYSPEQIQQQQPRMSGASDISDLLQSTRLHENSDMKPKETTMGSKLAYNEANVDPEGDAWGDDWDQAPEADPEESVTQPYAAKANMVTTAAVITQPQATAPSSRFLPRSHLGPSGLAFGSITQSLDQTKSVKDLFSMETNGPRTALTVPSPHIHGAQPDQPPQRRPSADLRPTEALFSTLDFASNALGSAVLGVHRKVTQAGQSHSLQSSASIEGSHVRPASPAWSSMRQGPLQETTSTVDNSARTDRLALTNPSLEAVGGNVVSTGLGALEILGKRAVDVISDVRRVGHLSHGQGGSFGVSDPSEDSGPFKIPPKMNVATLFESTGGRAHLHSMRLVASAATARVSPLTSNRSDLLDMGQLDELEQLLGSQSLDSAVGDLSVGLLAGHKDFRAVVSLLEQMGVQGTAHLRQLRNCTRKLGSLIPDSVNAFEQEWHNHQSRASERDFFAKTPIKKFFESRLLSIYFDGLRALSQFSERTCDQVLKLAENFNIRLAEKFGGANDSTVTAAESEEISVLALAQIVRQFLGGLISEAKLVAKTYSSTLDAVVQAAMGFTTPLDRLDWEDIAMGAQKIKSLLAETETPEAVGFIHTAAMRVADVLRNELLLDAIYGRIVPKARVSRPIPAANTMNAHAPLNPRSQTTLPSTQSSPRSASFSSLRSPLLEKLSGHSSPSLASRTLSSHSAKPPLGSQARPEKTLARPITPTFGPRPLTTDVPADTALAAGRRPPPASSQGSVRSVRKPPPPAPTLKDEDFFSILNGS